ncbi:hypothetical protein HPB50_028105 [Hyalomma asiaticum]|nr:hypothetical protein HPB50_028105 [Hyalomma asiaticum]
MFNDEQNFLYVQFLSPIVNEFDRINKIFQGEDLDPSKLYTDLSAFVKCLLRRVTLPDYASPDASWEDHLLHVRACNLGTTFRDSLEKSSLCEEEKNALLERSGGLGQGAAENTDEGDYRLADALRQAAVQKLWVHSETGSTASLAPSPKADTVAASAKCSYSGQLLGKCSEATRMDASAETEA